MKEGDCALKKSLKTGITSGRQIFTSLRNKVVNRIHKAKANIFTEIIKGTNGNGKLI